MGFLVKRKDRLWGFLVEKRTRKSRVGPMYIRRLVPPIQRFLEMKALPQQSRLT
jgi:hypothetical protein